ncbi:N-acetylglucosamine kinase [Microbacterium sp. ASV81]|uniref:BadF/BadG/BcrA/BcrD ATPase family protein n=1 Tax=Microbacterium capsulatum TaxID=3041921 RepID=A0ABU0XBK2_9MICO|nr:BadF/BadG/BcrA/BcrD ATPase family protein [Microbacterium sp. ASV81]MDQ4212332.1 BadF/BadG/BcrA/BcrD ATPase family protein [Microbacterium sp. ASV81]
MLVIGVDAGGTSTRAVLATAEGRCLGHGRGGSGNPTSAGIALAADGVLTAVQQALAAAGADLADVTAIVAAMAGHDSNGGATPWLADPLTQRGFRGTLAFESDLLAMYCSGAVAPVGYGVVCGTGASVVRVQDGRIVATADGLGWLLGDRGSGFWIGRRAAHAAVDELEGIGPGTALTPLVLEAAGVPVEGADGPGRDGRPRGLGRLIRALYAQRPVQLAELAPLVFTAAEDGDAVARAILDRAGELLSGSFDLVRDGSGPVVMGGSIVSRPGPVQARLRAHLDVAEGRYPVVTVESGVAGATMLALRHAGVPVGEEHLALLRSGLPG